MAEEKCAVCGCVDGPMLEQRRTSMSSPCGDAGNLRMKVHATIHIEVACVHVPLRICYKCWTELTSELDDSIEQIRDYFTSPPHQPPIF